MDQQELGVPHASPMPSKSKRKAKTVCDTCGRPLEQPILCVLCGTVLHKVVEITTTPAGQPMCADQNRCIDRQTPRSEGWVVAIFELPTMRNFDSFEIVSMLEEQMYVTEGSYLTPDGAD